MNVLVNHNTKKAIVIGDRGNLKNIELLAVKRGYAFVHSFSGTWENQRGAELLCTKREQSEWVKKTPIPFDAQREIESLKRQIERLGDRAC